MKLVETGETEIWHGVEVRKYALRKSLWEKLLYGALSWCDSRLEKMERKV